VETRAIRNCKPAAIVCLLAFLISGIVSNVHTHVGQMPCACSNEQASPGLCQQPESHGKCVACEVIARGGHQATFTFSCQAQQNTLGSGTVTERDCTPYVVPVRSASTRAPPA